MTQIFVVLVAENYQDLVSCLLAEEIEQDEEKRKTIEMYEEFSRQQKIEYERRKRRGGLYDWQLIDKTKFFKKWAVHIGLRLGHPLGRRESISLGGKSDSVNFLSC